MSSTFYDWYRASRLRSGLSTRQVGVAVGCDQSQISHIENSRRLPSPAHLGRFLSLMESADKDKRVDWERERARASDLFFEAAQQRDREAA